jgi:hypothetical protein
VIDAALAMVMLVNFPVATKATQSRAGLKNLERHIVYLVKLAHDPVRSTEEQKKAVLEIARTFYEAYMQDLVRFRSAYPHSPLGRFLRVGPSP